MESSVVVLHNEEPRAGTWEMSKGFETEHRFLCRIVEKYRDEFEGMGVVSFQRQKPKERGGRPVKEFLLNEDTGRPVRFRAVKKPT